LFMGLRKELVDEITIKVGRMDDRVRRDRLSAATTHKLYIQVTGNDAKPPKGRAWHLRKVCEELGLEPRKNMYHNGIPLAIDELQEIKDFLQSN